MITALALALHPGFTQRFIERRLEAAGIRIDGGRPWDLRVHDPRFYRRVLLNGSLGLGESYVERWWDCSDLDGFFCRLLRAQLYDQHWSFMDWCSETAAHISNRQSVTRSSEVARRHYDLHPDLYRAMLGEERVYSCAYWKDAQRLDDAQTAKIDLVCRKLAIAPGMRVLDIGCGWGTAARHAAERYGAEVVGITISAEQAVVARQRCAGLPVTILVQDYRHLEGRFDRVFSIGMFEHVGQRNYRRYLQVVRDHLAHDGLFLLHTIGADRSYAALDAWLDRYIFPNAVIPSARWLTAASEGLFVIEDWHNFGPDYDRTLMAWHARLEQSWGAQGTPDDERVRRLWRYYLLSCAASFRARKNHLWQLVLSPEGVEGGYTPVR